MCLSLGLSWIQVTPIAFNDLIITLVWTNRLHKLTNLISFSLAFSYILTIYYSLISASLSSLISLLKFVPFFCPCLTLPRCIFLLFFVYCVYVNVSFYLFLITFKKLWTYIFIFSLLKIDLMTQISTDLSIYCLTLLEHNFLVFIKKYICIRSLKSDFQK